MPTDDETSALRAITADMLLQQSRHCRTLGSELYAELLAAAADDCLAGGPTWAVLRPVATQDWQAALALRFMAAVHHLVLAGEVPDLALHYPSVGGHAGVGGAWEPFREALVDHRTRLSELAAVACQTNEVGRCRALIVGFLTIARTTGLPLRLLEVGASGGLNLRWDHFHYADEAAGRTWGPHDSPVQLAGVWDVDASLLAVPVEVADRAGCDPNPVDTSTEEGRMRLRSSLWADQVDRFRRLEGALEVAQRVPAGVVEAPAREWVPDRLQRSTPGVVSVIFHSVVWQYLPEADRQAMANAIDRASRAATPDAPVAWLSMEPDDPGRVRTFETRLRLWPATGSASDGGGCDQILATSGAHGYPVRQA